MNQVIVLNGLPRAGKDTFIGFMTEALDAYGRQSQAFSSIDPVRAMLDTFGVNTSFKTEADRKVLSVVGAALEEHGFFRSHACLRFTQQSKAHVKWLHIREPEMIERVRGWVLRGGRNTFLRIFLAGRGERITSNDSDAGVDRGLYDFTVVNDGTLADLRAGALLLAKLMVDEVDLEALGAIHTRGLAADITGLAA